MPSCVHKDSQKLSWEIVPSLFLKQSPPLTYQSVLHPSSLICAPSLSVSGSLWPQRRPEPESKSMGTRVLSTARLPSPQSLNFNPKETSRKLTLTSYPAYSQLGPQSLSTHTCTTFTNTTHNTTFTNTPFGSSLPRCQLHWKKLPTLYDATNKIVAVLSLLEHRLKNYIKNGTSVNYREIALSLMGTHKAWMKVTGDP